MGNVSPRVLLLVLLVLLSAPVQAGKSDVGCVGQWLLQHVTHKKSSCRTRFSWLRKPTDEDMQRLFDDTAQTVGFNHDCVGMTHPVIHSGKSASTECVMLGSGPVSQSSWIPDALSVGDDKPQEKWRTIRIRQTVGHGQACYEAVRDAILSWEQTLPAEKANWASIRLLHYIPHDKRRGRGAINRRVSTSSSVMEIGGPCKKLVTVSRSPLLGGLWTYNPCQVVYDVVDERHIPFRGSKGLTYTSSAYATLQGHLLSGEERVSVAIQDQPSAKVEVEVLSYSRPTKGLFGGLVFNFIRPMQQRFFQDQVNTLKEIGQEVNFREHELDHTQKSAQRPSCIFAAEKFVFGNVQNTATECVSLGSKI